MDASMAFDVVVVGAGPAGETAAGRCTEAGLTVALVERELVGGECAYWGCIPSKALVRPGDVIAAARRVPGAAQAVQGDIDVEAALARRNELTGGWDDVEALPWLLERRVEVVRGAGRIVGERIVEVVSNIGVQRLAARRAVILATGTHAAMPAIDGLAGAEPWDNRDATAVKHIPERLVVIGGGAAGLEIAQAFGRLGSREVTVIEAGPRLLAHEEPFASEEVQRALRAERIQVLTNARVDRVERAMSGDVHVLLADRSPITADEILVATGRDPSTEEIGLDVVGLEPGRFVEVDDQMRAVGVAGGWLYAIGDCNGRALFTHIGKYQAHIAAEVVMGRDTRAIADRAIVPRIAFTDPQVCAVGLTEQQARDAGRRVRAVRCETGSVSGAQVLADSFAGSSQLVIDEDDRTIIGATFVGPGLQELLHSATVAIAGAVTIDQLWHAVPPFPTVSEVWLRLLEALPR